MINLLVNEFIQLDFELSQLQTIPSRVLSCRQIALMFEGTTSPLAPAGQLRVVYNFHRQIPSRIDSWTRPPGVPRQTRSHRLEINDGAPLSGKSGAKPCPIDSIRGSAKLKRKPGTPKIRPPRGTPSPGNSGIHQSLLEISRLPSQLPRTCSLRRLDINLGA